MCKARRKRTRSIFDFKEIPYLGLAPHDGNYPHSLSNLESEIRSLLQFSRTQPVALEMDSRLKTSVGQHPETRVGMDQGLDSCVCHM